MKENLKKIIEAILGLLLKPFLDAKLKKEKILTEIEYKKATRLARGVTAKNYIMSRLKDAQLIRAARLKREAKAKKKREGMGITLRSIGTVVDLNGKYDCHFIPVEK